MTIEPRLPRIVAAQPYPLLFATISGAHLYGFGFPSPPRDGFPSRDVRFAHRGPAPDCVPNAATNWVPSTRRPLCALWSDFDPRGAHVLPLEKVVGLDVRDETVEQSFVDEGSAFNDELRRDKLACRAEAQDEIEFASAGQLRRESLRPDVIGSGRRLEMDIVSHDVRKFFGLLLKKNGYVLEQLFSPLIVHTTPEHEELKAICRPHPQPLSHPMGEGSVGSSTSPYPLPDRGGEGKLNPLTPSLSPSDGERVSEGRARGGSGVITKHHSHHYFGFAETRWKLFDKT